MPTFSSTRCEKNASSLPTRRKPPHWRAPHPKVFQRFPARWVPPFPFWEGSTFQINQQQTSKSWRVCTSGQVSKPAPQCPWCSLGVPCGPQSVLSRESLCCARAFGWIFQKRHASILTWGGKDGALRAGLSHRACLLRLPLNRL